MDSRPGPEIGIRYLKTIGVAIPTYCRPELLKESFGDILEDPRISEIIISDDCSPDGSFEKIQKMYAAYSPKVLIYRNDKNLDCYRNKKRAVELARSKWVILLDDDNVIKTDYIDALYGLPDWDDHTIYCPDFAQPHFDYTAFGGLKITRSNVGGAMDAKNFQALLNTSNYFFNRINWLLVWNGNVNPHTSDTIFQALNWLRSGRKLEVVRGLRYFHRIHDGSHYKNNVHKTGNFSAWVVQNLRELT